MDDLLQEIRRERESYAARFGFDLQAIHWDLKAREQAHDRQVVRRPPRRIKPLPTVASQSY